MIKDEERYDRVKSPSAIGGGPEEVESCCSWVREEVSREIKSDVGAGRHKHENEDGVYFLGKVCSSVL